MILRFVLMNLILIFCRMLFDEDCFVDCCCYLVCRGVFC